MIHAQSALKTVSCIVLINPLLHNNFLPHTIVLILKLNISYKIDRVEDVVRILPYKHQFHKSCIDQWLLEKRTCPMCKMDILKHYGLINEKKESKMDVEAMSGEPHEGTSMNQLA